MSTESAEQSPRMLTAKFYSYDLDPGMHRGERMEGAR
jgi:hypothetical protein